jgi:hypothetical protein
VKLAALVGGSVGAVVLSALLSALAVRAAGATEAVRGAIDVATVLYVGKSENRNQVHYGIHLDSRCAPAGDSPVFAYWRMLERGPTATEPLLWREERAYGLASQTVLARGPEGGSVEVKLFAVPARPLRFESRADGSGCVASAVTTVGGVPAVLSSVFVQLRWPFGVSSLTLLGQTLDDGKPVREKLRP